MSYTSWDFALYAFFSFWPLFITKLTAVAPVKKDEDRGERDEAKV